MSTHGSIWRRVSFWFGTLLRRGKLENELDAELRYDIERRAEANLRAGMTPEDARRAALREFGGLELAKEESRDTRGTRFIEQLWQDIRYCSRILRKSPGFTATAILTLALGIGATTSIFSVVDAVTLKPLPFPTASRLVRILSVIAATGHGGIASYPDFVDWRAEAQDFDGMAVFHTDDFTLIGPQGPQRLEGAVVSAQLFSVLGITPSLGRSFLPAEDQPGATNGTDPIILSYRLWESQFGSDSSALGRTIELGDHLFTIVGVMPQAFQFPIQAEPVQLWTTIAVDARGGSNAVTANRGAHYLDVIALLKPGVPLRRAQAEMVIITERLNRQHPEVKARTVQIVPELQGLAGPLRAPLFLLLAAVGCVLLIVCANVANLLLARAAGRHKEMALRAALGASRRRVIRQLLTESVALGLLGGGLGVVLAIAFLRYLVPLIPGDVPRLNAIGLDGRVLSFAFLISLLAGIVFGLAPALRISKINLTDSLKESGPGSGNRSKGHGHLRDILVVSEVALSFVLLLTSSLLIQSFLNLTRIDPGFDSHHVLTFQLDSPSGQSQSGGPEFFREILARVSAMPGVRSASAVAALPLTGESIRASIEIEGQPIPIASRDSTDFNIVEPNYFRTTAIPFVSGRDFTKHDDSKSTLVAIVNRALARRFFPNQDPIGKHIRPGIGTGSGSSEPPMREIVGVVGDVKQAGLGSEASPEVYVPLAQNPIGTVFLAIRALGDPQSVLEAVRLQVASLDKNVPLYHVESLDQYFAQSEAQPRFVTLLLTVFAGLAVLLACMGIYGVVSYIVVQRTHEIGIRMALGAEPSDILLSVLSRGIALTLAGIMIGLVAASWLAHLLSGLLYGLRATDPTTFAATPVVLLVVALMASYIPARRATRVDPMTALRHE